ncbi:response regulator transcription factor [Arthrobacter sp. ES3-54]|uniref:response regulator transcription factor n=1 Tax=Arthrobacter sp. ES3-54 TaxID=1502991 RepID=UPI0024064097|nr:response regulator transcription factor [Arthrobacter sp. ES3-54]MDF9751646.1 two-component system OmpR family response regulator [Arthrobacter sp. ES3-54]
MTQLRAVVVDDDADVRLLLRRTLEMQGFAVFDAASGSDALVSIQEMCPDLVTLDLNLPDLDGVEVCRRMRKFSEAYVVMITARADEIDELMGLETGADDFISKPFSPRTVQARVTAVMRRHRPTPQRPTPQRRATDFMPRATDASSAGTHDSPRRRASDAAAITDAVSAPHTPPRRRASDAAPGNPSGDPGVAAGQNSRSDDARVLRHGPLLVEAESRAASIDGVELVLTRTEFDLLEALTGAPRRVWTRKALLTKVWGTEWPMDEHLVEVHIGNLRRKLGDKGREPRFIRTVRGVGYRMAPAEGVG